MTEAKILLDSICTQTNCRLTTFEFTFPRIILAELNTHRQPSRNTASSRAIPNAKLRQRVIDNPFIPDAWGSNQKGMQAGDDLPPETAELARASWLRARDAMLVESEYLASIGVHKQLANRLLEPFMYVTAIVSATEWSNFFWLRYLKEGAQPQFKELAKKAFNAYFNSEPKRLDVGEWHLPLVTDEDRDELTIEGLIKVSTGRCARVSYLTHDGRRDHAEDKRLHNTLSRDGHWSPFEHVAQALPGPYPSGNFVGWHQYRKSFPNECYKSMVTNNAA